MTVVRLSIVIPVLGQLKKLEDTLVSVLASRPAQCEIVVVLNERYDDPYELAGEVRFIEAPPRAGVVDCLNLGVAASRGEIIHTLGCGTEVTPNWTDSVLQHFERSEVAAVTSVVVNRTNPEQTFSTGVGYRPGGVAWRLGYQRSVNFTDARLPSFFGPDLLAGFCRKSAWEAVGGLCPRFHGYLAGLDLALALHFANWQCIREPNCHIFADYSDLPEGELLGSGRQAERLFWRWAWRMGFFRAFAGHIGLLANECLECVVRPLTVLRLFGRAWETISVPFCGRSPKESAVFGIPEESIISRPHFMKSLDNTPIEVSKAS
jgi:GT2 family glycosyltransferase